MRPSTASPCPSRSPIARTLMVAACFVLAFGTRHPARAADGVTEWTLLADRFGRGAANWHTLAIMHQAMHDALNAALPVYARWATPGPDEPSNTGAVPQVAMAAAAARVLSDLHPDQRVAVAGMLRAVLERTEDGGTERAGVALGDAIGAAAVARRAGDGYRDVRAFSTGTAPGQWRHTPQEFRGSNTTRTRPFLFASRAAVPLVPPPAPGSPAYVAGVEVARRLGAVETAERTPDQADAAMFWAYQSSQRGFVHLAVTLLDRHPRPGGVFEHARIMSQLTVAMADAAIVSWLSKERYTYWRPITAIRLGGYGVEADPAWEPLIETPPHPEYPSGHAADCFTGAGVLAASLGRVPGPIRYVARLGEPQPDAVQVGMGQHAQLAPIQLSPERSFPTLAAAAEECSLSRVWAGAHFPAAQDEARRIGRLLTQRAMASLPQLLP